MTPFVHLHVHSQYSILDGMAPIKDLVDKAIADGLGVMDMTAFTLCKENDVPIVVFNINKDGELRRVVEGENVGTVVSK